VYLEYDSALRGKDDPENPTLAMVLAAFRNGFGAQVLLGTDSGRRRYWKSYGGGPGLAYLLKVFAPMLLEAGLRGEDLRRILISNPACAFSLGEAMT
jgi:phosphotriesterase-related protein